jgi:hypothetical protein
MTLDIKSLVKDLQAVDLSTASPVKMQAIGSIARMLYPHTKDVHQLFYDISDETTERFAQAETIEEREQWLEALMHFTPRDYLFCDIVDEAEYQALSDQAEEIEARWLEGLTPLLHASGFTHESISDRLRHLQTFFRQDINLLSEGDDEKAKALLAAVNSEFERCREQLFTGDTEEVENYIRYYHVLSAIRPDQTAPDNARYYQQYFQTLSERIATIEPGSDAHWAYRETRCHHQLALDNHADQAALAGLWLAKPESCAAFRCQLYKWHLALDPSDPPTMDGANETERYADEGISRLSSWFTAKQKADIQIPVEQQAGILMTYALARSVGASDSPLDDYFYLHAYDVLAQLKPSKLNTHLKVRIDSLLPNERLRAEAKSEIQTWKPSELTQEDKFLMEDLSLS